MIYNIQYWICFSEHIYSHNILKAQTEGKVKVEHIEHIGSAKKHTQTHTAYYDISLDLTS